MKKPELRIRIYQCGKVIREWICPTKRQAKEDWEREFAKITQYTALVVDGQEMTVAKAKRFFQRKPMKKAAL